MSDKEVLPLAYEVRESVCNGCGLSDRCTRKTVFKFDGVCNTRNIKLKLTLADENKTTWVECPRCGSVSTNVPDWDWRICPWCREPIDKEEME